MAIEKLAEDGAVEGLGEGIGARVGVGVGVDVDDGVGTGAGAGVGFFAGADCFQINFLPDFTHVYVAPLTILVAPALAQLEL